LRVPIVKTGKEMQAAFVVDIRVVSLPQARDP